MSPSEARKPITKSQREVSAVIDKLEILGGEVIADLGCGRGLWAFELAKVTGGAVYAADIRASLLGSISSKRGKATLGNIKAVLSGRHDARLPECCDLIFMRNVFHHIEGPLEYFFHLKSYLKPDGRLAVIDWKPGTGHAGHESSEEAIYRTLLRAGYIRIRSYDFLNVQSFNIFTIKNPDSKGGN